MNSTADENLGPLFNEISAKHPDGIWATDKDDRIVFFNHAMENISGIKAENALGKKTPDDFAKGTLEYLIAFYNKAKSTLEPVEYETEVVTPVGHKTIQHGWCIPRIQNYKFDGIICTIKDVTARKQAEEALRKSEEKNRLFIENFEGIAYQVSHLTFKPIFFQGAVEKITGYKAEDFISGRILWNDLILMEHLENVFNAGKKLRDIPGFIAAEKYAIRSRDGRVKWVHDIARAIRSKDGETAYFQGTIYDITDLVRMAEELQKAQKLESLGLLAGGIAHDFNNLLGGIFGYIDMAAAATKEKEVADDLAKVLSTIDRARALTGQLLTFAKGGAPIKKLERLVPFIEETTKFALSGSNVSCKFSLAENLLPCEFDRNQIGQVISNIVINAQQAMPEGGPVEVMAENICIAEKSHAALPKGNYVKIAFKDHGIGMPIEILPKIFDPFFTTKAKGHGLGLATCYSIIKRHGGCIEVESEPGRGSTFAFYLPASSESEAADRATITATHHGSGSILVMDDEEVIRGTLSFMLKTMGYKVHCVSNSKEAMEEFNRGDKEENRLSAVILDLTIPGGPGGKETIREIRKNDKDVPAFVTSGYADDPVMANPTEYGFNGSICKPFIIAELAKLLNEHMKKSK